MSSLLSLVVEMQHLPQPFWVSLPPAPWPDFVELSGDSTDEEVALVLFELAKYNQGNRPTALSPEDLAGADNLVLPGGVQVSSERITIRPSCCSGLECWVEWLYLLEDGTPPWMGHDPTPTVDPIEGGGCRIWPDEVRTGESVSLDAQQLKREVSGLQVRIHEFHQRLSAYLERHLPEHAASVSQAFWTKFRVAGPSAA
jgi:hypothetical protein